MQLTSCLHQPTFSSSAACHVHMALQIQCQCNGNPFEQVATFKYLRLIFLSVRLHCASCQTCSFFAQHDHLVVLNYIMPCNDYGLSKFHNYIVSLPRLAQVIAEACEILLLPPPPPLLLHHAWCTPLCSCTTSARLSQPIKQCFPGRCFALQHMKATLGYAHTTCI